MGDGYELQYAAAEIDRRLGMAGNAILYTEQALTEDQKARARANIGAGSTEDAPPKFVNNISECTDILREYVLPDGYIYRYMKTFPKVTYETHDEVLWQSSGTLTSFPWVLSKNTNIIPVKEGDQFKYTGNGAWNASVFWLKSALTTDILSTETYGNERAPQTVTVTAPAGAKYVMFASWDYDDVETVLVVVPLTESDEPSWQSTGIAYGTSKEYDERIALLEEAMRTLKEDGVVGDVLKGKKIVYDGDSIAESRLGTDRKSVV